MQARLHRVYMGKNFLLASSRLTPIPYERTLPQADLGKASKGQTMLGLDTTEGLTPEL